MFNVFASQASNQTLQSLRNLMFNVVARHGSCLAAENYWLWSAGTELEQGLIFGTRTWMETWFLDPEMGFWFYLGVVLELGLRILKNMGFFLIKKSDLNWMLTVSYQLFFTVLFCVSKNSMGTGSDLHNQNWNLNWNWFFWRTTSGTRFPVFSGDSNFRNVIGWLLPPFTLKLLDVCRIHVWFTCEGNGVNITRTAIPNQQTQNYLCMSMLLVYCIMLVHLKCWL